jgi:RNA-directed DNA polymerase
MMVDGVCRERYEGTPQGGPLSPLLANLLLDDLDRELERRGHRFCRYADDCNIFVRSQAAGERVMASVTGFLEGRLRLKVNRQKSAVAPVGERQFLGHRLGTGGRIGIGRTSEARVKHRLRAVSSRNRGILFARLIAEVAYDRHAQCQSTLRAIDGWLRRKLRCLRLKHCKRPQTMIDCLRKHRVPEEAARKLASSGKGWWRLADSRQSKTAMTTAWFQASGLISLAAHHAALNLVGNRRDTWPVRPVV